MNRKDKKPYIITAIIIILISLIIIYIYLNSIDTIMDWGKFFWYLLQTFLITSALGVLLYVGINKLNHQDVEKPKELLPSTKVWEIWKEEYAKINGIPIDYSGKQPRLLNPRAIIIRDCISHKDPHSNTSDSFMKMEVKISEGYRTGQLVTIVQVDMGEKFLREHWNDNIIWNTSLNNYHRNLKTEPMTNPQTANERMYEKKMEALEEGMTESEVNALFSPYMQKPQVQQVTKESKPQKVVVEQQQNQTHEPQEDELEGIEEDINAYREANK